MPDVMKCHICGFWRDVDGNYACNNCGAREYTPEVIAERDHHFTDLYEDEINEPEPGWSPLMLAAWDGAAYP